MHKKYNWILLLLLVLLLVAIRLPSFAEPLDNDSGSVAFLARQMLRGEVLYGKFHPTHHLPGIYYTFEAAFKLFGDTAIAPKLFLLPWTLACAWLIFLMGRLYIDRRSGLLGAIFYILLSSQVSMKGTTVEMEQFANLPLTAGVFLVIVLLRNKVPAWQFVWVGIIGAICILYKIIFVGPLAVAGIAILAKAWIERRQRTVLKTAFLRMLWMSIGLVLPLAAVGAYFASLGLWDRVMLVFRIGFGYMGGSGMFAWLPPPFGFPIFWMGVSNAALLIFGLIGTYRCARRAIPLQTTEHLTNFMLVLWLIFSFAEAGLRWGGWEHYTLLVVPPLALLAASEISAAYERWKVKNSERQALIGMSAMIALVILIFVMLNYDFYSQYISYKLGRISYEDFIYGYTGTSGTGPAALNAEIIGHYIQSHTTPDDLIYLASENVQSYYYADREPPIDIIWPDYIFVTGPAERIFDPRTKYIVLDTPEKIDHPQWLMDGLKRYYYLETVIGGQEIYRRRA
ncbi:MAG TPA: hypothetical protein VK206_22065 [Anaerolineales bacterium]|nr:hypothetical protein [Anaerolineales bacterium]HLO32229.1 hypothetical protein [Anaerolineales bacterium]